MLILPPDSIKPNNNKDIEKMKSNNNLYIIAIPIKKKDKKCI